MRTISLTQPWASLVIDGRKKVETRGWRTSYRGLLAIHATREIDVLACRGFRMSEDLPTRSILGAVMLVDVLQFGAIADSERRFGALEMSYGDFEPGRYGWVLKDPYKFAAPKRVHGSPGIWEWICGCGEGTLCEIHERYRPKP